MKIKSIIQSDTDLQSVCFGTEPEITQDLVEEVNRKLKGSKAAKLREVALKNNCLSIPTEYAKPKIVSALETLLTEAEASLSERKKRNNLVLEKLHKKLSSKLGLKLEKSSTKKSSGTHSEPLDHSQNV